MAQEILSIYKADVSNLISEVNKVVDANQEITKQEKDANKEIQKGIDLQESSSKKRLALLKQEQAELERLRKIRKLTYDPKDIALVDQKINQLTKSIQKSSAAIKQTGTETKKTFSEIGSSVKTIGLSIAASLGAAFTIDTIIQFGKASVNAFLEAEESASRLRFAVVNIAGETEVAFESLLDQASQVQKSFGIADESIQGAQAALLSFGLSTEQVKQAIPVLVDFAAVTGQDVASAVQAMGQAIQGRAGEFKRFGIQVSETATEVDNFNAIISGLASQEGAAAEQAKTLSGQLKIQQAQLDELQESVGEQLAPAWVKLKNSIFLALDALLRYGKVNAITNKDISQQAQFAAVEVVESIKKQTDSQTQQINLIGELIEINQKEKDSLELNLKLRTNAGKLTRKEAEDIQSQIVLKEGLIKAYSQEVDSIKSVIIQEEKLLKANDLQVLSLERLNELLKENQADNSIAAQSNVKLITQELEARKKLETELKKNQENLLKLQIANIEDLKAQRIAVFEAETKALTSEGKLRADTIIEMEKQLVRDLNEIDKQREFKPLVPIQPEVDFTEPEVKPINPVPEKLELPPVDGTEFNNSIDAIEAKTLAGWLDTNGQMLDATQSLINSLTELYDNYAEGRIDQINREKDAQLDALDIEEKQIDSQLKRRGISEKEAEDRKAELTKRRIKIEEEAARKEREIKRKQFILDKAAALIEIIIETAKNIASATNPALIALYAAVGAAQGAVVASQPIPYKKGSKDTGAKGHLARVGEEGEEIVFMPARSKVLPAKPTKTYGEVLNTMFDGTFDKHYTKREISPRLVKQRKNHEKDKEKQFAENIRESVTINNMLNSRGDYFLEKMEKQGVKFRNLDELYQILNNNRQSPKR